METFLENMPGLPVTVVRGSRPGPRVLITAGVHGGEYAAIAAGFQLVQRLHDNVCSGQVTLVCPANLNAFWQRTEYVDPLDGKNLGSVFPGNPQGSSAERTAYRITELIKQSDCYLDLHSGDIHEKLTPFSLFPSESAVSQRSLEMARMAGLPYIIPMKSDGLPICCAAGLHKPGVMVEMGGCGRWNEAESRQYVESVVRILRGLGVVQGAAAEPAGEVLPRYVSEKAPLQACWQPYVEPGTAVTRGQKIGRLFDFQNRTLKEYFAEDDAVVLYVVTSLSVRQGGSLYALGIKA